MLTLHLLENCSSNVNALGTTYNLISGDDKMLLQLEHYIISCHTLEEIDSEFLISTSGP